MGESKDREYITKMIESTVEDFFPVLGKIMKMNLLKNETYVQKVRKYRSKLNCNKDVIRIVSLKFAN